MMMTESVLDNARKFLIDEWGDDGKLVISACEGIDLNMTSKEFLSTCQASGGDWGKMLLSGIKAASNEVYDSIPKKMGKNGNEAFLSLCAVVQLLGVDTSA